MARNVRTSLELNLLISGNLYCFSNFYNLAMGASKEIILVTTDRPVAITSSALLRGDATIEFFELSTATEGAASVVHNANRASPNTSSLSIHESPTGITQGTQLTNIAIPGGFAANTIGFDLDVGGGFILKPDTKHLFRITNDSSGTKDYSISFTWTQYTKAF